jgi:ribose 5-phosphate isomerase A
MAASLVSVRVRSLGGAAATRPGYLTDDGLAILDVAGLSLDDPERLEAELDAIPGVVENGLFARRRADVVLAGSSSGVRTIVAPPDLVVYAAAVGGLTAGGACDGEGQ